MVSLQVVFQAGGCWFMNFGTWFSFNMSISLTTINGMDDYILVFLNVAIIPHFYKHCDTPISNSVNSHCKITFSSFLLSGFCLYR